MKKSVTVRISDQMIAVLLHSHYRLCIGKRIREDPDIRLVWQSWERFFPQNTFSWTDAYALSYTSYFVPGSSLALACTPVPVAPGEQATLDRFGCISSPISGQDPDSICLVNECGLIFPVLSQQITGIDNKSSCSPFYISSGQLLKGTISFRPIDSLCLWFEQNLCDDLQLAAAKTVTVDLDLSSQDQITVLFDQQSWSICESG